MWYMLLVCLRKDWSGRTGPAVAAVGVAVGMVMMLRGCGWVDHDKEAIGPQPLVFLLCVWFSLSCVKGH